jgi:hypothetical protein
MRDHGSYRFVSQSVGRAALFKFVTPGIVRREYRGEAISRATEGIDHVLEKDLIMATWSIAAIVGAIFISLYKR